MRPDDTAPEGAVSIPLRTGDGTVRAYAIVDAADADDLSRWRWKLTRGGYAERGGMFRGKQRNFLLHRQLLGLVPGDGLLVDHINRDKLDNRRSNLRIVTAAQNSQNRTSLPGSSSKFLGVWWNKKSNCWSAKVARGSRAIWVGNFASEDQAAEAVRQARDRLDRELQTQPSYEEGGASLIGKAIRARRQASEMQGKRLAELAGISPQYVTDIELGRRLPSVDVLLRISNQFPDVDPAQWLWLLLADDWGTPIAQLMRSVHD